MSVASFTRNDSLQRSQDRRGLEAAPKLRSSCDNCHSAKVKCTPTASQSCVRCLSHNTSCIYSPSLRISKVASLTRQSSASVPCLDTDIGTRQPATGREGRGVSVLWDSAPPNLSSEGQSGLRDDGRMDMEGLEDMDQMAAACGFVPSTPSTSSGVATTATSRSSASDYIAPLWQNETTIQSNQLSDHPTVNDTFLWNLGDSMSVKHTQSLPLPSLQRQESATTAANTDSRTTSRKGSLQQTNGRIFRKEAYLSDEAEEVQPKNSCDCHVQLLEALQVSPQLSKPARTKGGGTATIAFDIILATNKRAIGKCMTMLGCKGCFGDSTSILLTTTLLSQTLALYHSACEVYLAPGPGSKASTADGNRAGCDGGGDEEMADEPIVPGPLRLNIGRYELEEEDEILLKKELMLIELRKVEGLISRLRSLIGQVDDPSESGAYETLLAWLTRHLQRTVGVIQPRRPTSYDRR